jgi:RNA polymerase sigma factor FliA
MANDRAPQAQSGVALDPGGALGAPGVCSEYRPVYSQELDETEIINQHVPTVKRIASHLKGRLPETVQLDDLIQAGLIAVLRIMRQGGGQQLEDAMLRRSIMNAMVDEARRETWAPARTVRLAKAAAHAIRAVRQRTGRQGSDEEIAAEMKISLAEYHRLLVDTAGLRLLHLEDFGEAGEEPLQVTDNQELSLARSRIMAALAESIALLPEREKLVVSLYYEHELNMDEVGKVLGLNKSTVSRTHGRALLMLRSALGDWSAADAAPLAAGD